MKKIDTTNISGLAKAPFIKATHDHLKESIQETTGNIIKGLLGSYTPGDLIVLYGCVVTATIPGTSSITAGAIYYNGEIYEVDANAALVTSGGDTLIWDVVTTYIASDSTLQWSDGVTRDLHRIDKLALSAGTTGSGLADWDGATVKYLSKFIVKAENISLKTKVVNIGNWNMDTTGTVAIAHGIPDFTKIRHVDVFIIKDDSSMIRPLIYMVETPGSPCMLGGIVRSITSTNINLERISSVAAGLIYAADPAVGVFDNTDYDSVAGFNRGWITIIYEV